MIYSLKGKIASKQPNFLILETGGIGFKIFAPVSVLAALPSLGEETRLFTYYYLREDAAHLYGFLTERDLEVFEMLNSVTGIGPKTALGVLSLTSIDNLLAAIKEGRVELLTKVSGIGKKTAERIVLELKEKIQSVDSEVLVSNMESDADILSALITLGYGRDEIKEALGKIDSGVKGLELRVKEALRLLKSS